MAHYYTRKGELVNGADLRQAKKEELYPSVTTVMSIVKNDGLNNWLNDQLLMAALTTDRKKGESEKEFIQRIKSDADEHSRQARDFGTTIHNLIERYVKKEHIMIEDYDERTRLAFSSVVEWINDELSLKKARVEKTFVYELYGFAGTADFSGFDFEGKSVLIDWKTQAVKMKEYKSRSYKKFEVVEDGIIKRPKPVFYPEWIYQLGALNSVERHDRVISVIIDTNNVGGIYTKEYTHEQIEEGKWTFRAILDCYKAVKKYYVGGKK